MAKTCMTLSAVLMALFVSSTRAQNKFPPINHDLLVATEEMQKANYFTFVMLINMAPGSLTQGNITLLVPNDRTLAQTLMPENEVVEFLLRHSIPSPLLFEHLVKIPTGSVIPTGKHDFSLRISNSGMRSFYLNNVRIIRPDVCTKGSSFRCHGIDKVVQAIMVPGHNHPPLPPPSGSNSSSPVAAAAPPAVLPPLPPPPLVVGGIDPTPLHAPPPSTFPSDQNGRPLKSGSSQPLPFAGLPLGFMVIWLILVFSIRKF